MRSLRVSSPTGRTPVTKTEDSTLREVLAPGAPAPDGFIPLSAPEIRGSEWKYVKECLDTGWVSSAGPFVNRFERMVAEYVGARWGVATCSGTAALHIGLLVAGVLPDDEVIVPTLTFIAPANAVRYCGAWPVFMDADPVYWQMDVGKLADFLSKQCAMKNGELINKGTGRRVKAVLPVHLLGHPCDMDAIIETARRCALVVIEDASESLGARYKDRPVGHLGDIACFSFNGNKIITTGGGGLIVTDNAEWGRRAKYLTTQAKDDPVEYVHREIGYNYRLTNLQAALGCAQLERIDNYIASKRRTAARYSEALSDLPGVTCMFEAPWASSIFWMYTILLDRDVFGADSRTLMRYLERASIQSRPLWEPLHLSFPYRECQSYHCEVSERIYRDALNLPNSVGLKDADQRRVVEALIQARGVS